jgi:alkanesulfonate monooxygenase SsuD/methylene tetrahydromethanopterin reductase-like flavin-dependent oxidoreductase (luciferase family)
VTPWDLSDRSARSLTEQAALAERMGYASFWLPENHFNPEAIPDPLMLLAAVAAGTHTIRLATTSYLLPVRNPLQAAEQVAVLDQLSGGRVILGVGRGYAPTMLKAFDVDPRDKRRMFEQGLQQMLRAWSGAPIGLEGGEEVILAPLPVQRPHPPIWVAAFGPKALAQAGRLGLPYLASPIETLETLASNYARHADAAAEAGHALPAEVPAMRTLFLARSGAEADRVRDQLRRQASASGRLAADTDVLAWSIVGEAGYIRERVAEYRETLGLTHLIVTRLLIGGVPGERLARSVAEIAEVLG